MLHIHFPPHLTYATDVPNCHVTLEFIIIRLLR